MHSIIAISPGENIADESDWINRLFEAGIDRYHIAKDHATEQSIAEILQHVHPKYLSKITLHSHFHLVLAYGVGGIHYAELHRQSLKDDFPSKVKLYQSFGIKVSTSVDNDKVDWASADYIITSQSAMNGQEGTFLLAQIGDGINTTIRTAFHLSSEEQYEELLNILKQI